MKKLRLDSTRRNKLSLAKNILPILCCVLRGLQLAFKFWQVFGLRIDDEGLVLISLPRNGEERTENTSVEYHLGEGGRIDCRDLR